MMRYVQGISRKMYVHLCHRPVSHTFIFIKLRVNVTWNDNKYLYEPHES